MDWKDNLIDFITSAWDFIKDSPMDNLVGQLGLFRTGDLSKYFNASVIMSYEALGVSFFVCIIMLFATKDELTAARMKSMFIQVTACAGYLTILFFVLEIIFRGGDLFTELWSPKANLGTFMISLLPAAGVAVVGILASMGTALLVFLALAFIFFYVQVVLNAVLFLLLAAVIILYPMAIALYPIPFQPVKKLFINLNILLATLVLIKPFQNLFTTLAMNTVLSGPPELSKIIAPLIALFIINIIVLPGIAIAGFMKIMQLSNG